MTSQASHVLFFVGRRSTLLPRRSDAKTGAEPILRAGEKSDSSDLSDLSDGYMAYCVPCAFEFPEYTAAGESLACSVLIRTYPYLSVPIRTRLRYATPWQAGIAHTLCFKSTGLISRINRPDSTWQYRRPGRLCRRGRMPSLPAYLRQPSQHSRNRRPRRSPSGGQNSILRASSWLS